ncbi:MAG TPA: hypothetical protein VMU83_16695 [Hanamia sp.]|nr:hypothetical protein [Hanamia sp.]
MTKEEINEFIEDRFKKINKHFRKAIDNFEAEDIRKFRTEIKKLKVFLHLLNMESEDGLSYRITNRMKTIYGYFGIVQNFQLQLKVTNDYIKNNLNSVPLMYLNNIEKELEYWEKHSQDFIDKDSDFFNDEKEIVATLPDKLSKESIKKFIHYTLYELQMISGRSDDAALESIRKFLEDIFYNLAYIKPFFTDQRYNQFDEKIISECLELFEKFRNKNIVIVNLRNCNWDSFDEHEKQLLLQMESNYLHEKKELTKELISRLDAIHIKADNLGEFAIALS